MAGMFGDIHGGIRGAEQAISGGAIVWVDGDSNACGALERVAFDAEGFIEAALQTLRDLLHSGGIVNLGDESGKFVATKPRKGVVGAKLPLHSCCHFLKVKVTNLVPVEVVHLLEIVEIDVNQAEDSSIETRLFDARFEQLVEREPIVEIGEQIEFGAVKQIAVESPGFNGESGQSRAEGEGFQFQPRGFRVQGECRVKRSQGRARACRNGLADHAKGLNIRWHVSQSRSVGYFAPAARPSQAERQQLGDFLQDFGEGTDAIDVFKDAASPFLDLGLSVFEGGL